MTDRFGKRIMDVCLAGLGLVVLSPVLVGVGIAVRLIAGSPVLFRQLRPGLNGRLFEMRKFRTMRDIRDENGVLLPDAQRLGQFGRFLRSTSLDELPELFNVLVGDMSLVGPRPLLPEYLPLYTAEQAQRHTVRPGITGWAQVNGRNAISWEEKFRLDVWYVNHGSLLVDLKILCMTVRKIFVRDGITQEGHVTAERFRGSRGESHV